MFCFGWLDKMATRMDGGWVDSCWLGYNCLKDIVHGFVQQSINNKTMCRIMLNTYNTMKRNYIYNKSQFGPIIQTNITQILINVLNVSWF